MGRGKWASKVYFDDERVDGMGMPGERNEYSRWLVKNDGEKDEKNETLGCLNDDQGEAEWGIIEKERSESGAEEERLGSRKGKRKSYE